LFNYRGIAANWEIQAIRQHAGYRTSQRMKDFESKLDALTDIIRKRYGGPESRKGA
jgi:hypothetical protein